MGQRFKAVVNSLMRDIFSNKLAPGDKLAAERELSKKMDIDRTSLRIALKQLEALGVLEIRQGDGIYVKDYMKNAGLDFLRLLFLQEEQEGEGPVIDEYIIDEAMEFWVEFMPLMVKVALRRITPLHIKRFVDTLNNELEVIGDPKKVVESELLQQEMVAEATDNLLFLLLSNTTRPLRKKFLEIFVSQLDKDTMRRHVEFKRALLRSDLVTDPRGPEVISDGYKKMMVYYRDVARKSWQVAPEDDRLVKQFMASVDAGQA
ncbi:MAG: FadR/GntR family transcriptional regulator [Thermodesulfobacteriota bacterium]